MKNELLEKYHIVSDNGKRYYEFDMNEKLPVLDDTTQNSRSFRFN